MEMKGQTLWALVSIVLILVTGAVLLVLNDKDVSVIISLVGLVVVPILGALGVAVYQKLEQVKDQGNGNINKLLEAQQKTQEQLANLAMMLPSLTPQQIEQVQKTSTDQSSSTTVPYDDFENIQLRTPR
jgi:hypothetical protein